jgi:hypothetical protein
MGWKQPHICAEVRSHRFKRGCEGVVGIDCMSGAIIVSSVGSEGAVEFSSIESTSRIT